MRFTLWAAIGILCLGVSNLSGQEDSLQLQSWSDVRLPVKAGLEIWLDAASQPAARKAMGKSEIRSGDKLSTWLDGSRHGRHVVQTVELSQPKLMEADGHWSVRFDGVDDYLAKSGLMATYRDLTICIAAVPFSNAGEFRAFAAMNRDKVNDYLSGITLDQGPMKTAKFQSLNPEGIGFAGATNAMRDAVEFGAVTRLAVSTTPGAGGTKLFVNGKSNGQRDRSDSTIGMDQLTVGARFYNNAGPANARGFLEGEIAEVLVYNRVLTAEELGQIDRYFADKHGIDRRVPLPKRSPGHRLVSVPDPPPVQMFVPGFSVFELPLDLTNINNLKYRPDGKLVALAYDGNIYLLSDTNGDGLEDKAELYWENQGRLRSPIGMALAPQNYAGNKYASGVFVAAKGKFSLIADTDGDNKADREIVLAEGWKELDHGVDALGAAYNARDGSVYFGLGAAAFTGAYQLDAAGKSGYSLKSERGTILKISPEGAKRESVCTGIRFPVAMAFNARGDLFCTDQEGATWLPNGNPLDELLHIERGRHYGFPPRHPQHLPSVIDEPSVCDYKPQHQSTCGLNFNESVNGGPVFGPAAWRDDALVCGYSRGKLYRTQLAKTAAGYVSSNHLLASLNMLTCDACVSPRGELAVCVHSGGPDWGNGPSGKGKLYKIRYTQPELPQPVAVWAQSPQEVCVAFDKPIEPEQLREVSSRITIDFGKYVAAGDRFESLRPGYQVVQDQLLENRDSLAVLGTSVTTDRRTLIIATAPHELAVNYALTLPGLGRPGETPQSELRQVPETNLQYDLNGISVEWSSQDGAKHWNGWLPHLDTSVARTLTAGSSLHGELWSASQEPGSWRFKTSLNLWQMLRPAVQPGAQLDHEWPAEEVILTLESRSSFKASSSVASASATAPQEGQHLITLTFRPRQNELIPLLVEVDAARPLEFNVTYHTNEDARPRALPVGRFILPWANLTVEQSENKPRELPAELAGGSWSRGRGIFFGEQAGCAKCHTLFGQGGKIGPNLSNLPQRDYASVRRDIEQPSFAVNPDHVAYNIVLEDGRVLTGTLRTQGDDLSIGDTQGRVVTVKRSEIETIKPSSLSIMPEGIPKAIGPERMRDLLTFLLTPPPSMPLSGTTPPPSRTHSEVDAVLADSRPPVDSSRPLHIVLIAGPKDHGPGEHDYPAWQQVWKQLLSLADGVRVTTAMNFPSNDDLKSADVLVFYQQGQWAPERAAAIDAHLARDGGVVYLHYAVDGGADPTGMSERIGLAWKGNESRFRHGELDLDFSAAKHPIIRNFKRVHFHDESYWKLVGDPTRISLLASGEEDGTQQPLLWITERGKGRVFVSILGHYSWTFDDPLFRTLVLRGIAWSANEPVDRFNELVTVGARLADDLNQSK